MGKVSKPAMDDSSQDSTLTLLRAAQEGDPHAFGELAQKFEERLFRQALFLCGNATQAEDLAQETLFTAWKRLGQFHHRCQFFTWLCGILLNLARNTSRKMAPVAISDFGESSRQQVDHLLDALVDPGESPAETIEREERARAIRCCLDRLPLKHREVIQLRFFVDDSIDGISAALDCSVGTVKSRLFHALEKLHAMPELVRLATPKPIP
jgi:RNA polymerase sigma-70 factor (ECF subfamily)